MKTMKLLCCVWLCCCAWTVRASGNFTGAPLAAEGAWCWFADPRALHYENESGTINASYVGYIDVHGNIRAVQVDFLTGERSEVLVRSAFQPDDHNNPTFLVLPDERVLIIYSRHTDEAAFYYRVSRKPGDITMLGEEKRIATDHNTTYPSPFILSDDPGHFYLCWRGLGLPVLPCRMSWMTWRWIGGLTRWCSPQGHVHMPSIVAMGKTRFMWLTPPGIRIMNIRTGFILTWWICKPGAMRMAGYRFPQC